MNRQAFKYLIEWKNKKDRKPLILQGARQVGKTWLMKEFGKTQYKNVAYVNFDNIKNKNLTNIFFADYNIDRIIESLSIETKTKIVPNDTLIILDEIQECPKALTSLKYFYENAPQYNIVCAGSLLGIILHQETSFPVGKVDFLNVYPLSFFEFLEAIGEKRFVDLITSLNFDSVKIFKDEYIRLLKVYFYTGGMPEVVSNYVKNKDFKEVRNIQNTILQTYEKDFSKHLPVSLISKTRMLWNNIPAQFAKENKKFIYGIIKHGARAKEYENSLFWLKDCGLIYEVYRISKPAIPVKSYIDTNSFKLFLVDIGLLCALSDIDAEIMLDNDSVFEEFTGSLTEQYVLQQLKVTDNKNLYYWSADRGTAEIDFLIQYKNNVVPIEVKATTNLKSKSLKVYTEKFQPNVSVRTSLADYKKTDILYDIPLYMIENLTNIINL